MRKIDPLFAWQQLHKILLYLYRVTVFRQAKPAAEPRYVCIYNNAGGQTVSGPQHNVRRLTANSRQFRQCVEFARHLPVILFRQSLAAGPDVLRLVPEETRALDDLLER